MAVDTKRIAKNTIYMYIRMIIIMGVSFYTSRVVLDKLGVDDYGLFNAVGGVVGMLSFLNNTLAKGTSRFLTFELGNNNADRLKATFSTAFYSHLMLMVLLLIVLETAGVWFLNNKLVIPDGRMFAAQWVYQISLLTMCLGVLQVPFTSCVIAHEDMSLYAYLSIFEAVGKLAIVYVLSISAFDKLILYSALIFLMQLLVFFIYIGFNKHKYSESKLQRIFDQQIFKNMLGFSGWNIIANLSETLKMQGSNILINMFFRPALVAAMAISNQVTAILMNFIYQFTTVLEPQIIKTYAAGDYKSSQKLNLDSTILVFDLVIVIFLPLIFVIEPILDLWLVEVPENTVQFIQVALATQIAGVFNVTLYTPMVASGKLKTNSLWGLYLGVGQFAVVYFIYKSGGDVMCLPYSMFTVAMVFSLLVKPYIAYKEIGYDIKNIVLCFYSCFKVLILSVLLTWLADWFLVPKELYQYLTLLIISVLIIMSCSFIFMEKSVRIKLINIVKERLRVSKS